jgi:hypothetical protein
MKRMLVVLIAVVTLAAGALFAMGRSQSGAVKVCRADAQRFDQEAASYQAEYDSLYGATTLAQRPMSELLDRDKELMGYIETDPSHGEQYKTVLYRDGFIQGNRFFAYMLDTKQLQDFAKRERDQQTAQLASYRKRENQ